MTLKKPAIYKLHDFIKGGTDMVDRRIGIYTCGQSLDAGQLAAFSYGKC